MNFPIRFARGGERRQRPCRGSGAWALVLIPVLLVVVASPSRAENPPFFESSWGRLGAGSGQFNEPRSVAFDAARGHVYVAERLNQRMQKFTTSGSHLATMDFVGPQGVAVDGAGNCYVLDTAGNRVKKFSVSGGFLTQWGLMGSGDGQLLSPGGIAVDGSGNVYVADTWNYRIQKFRSSGAFVTKWGSQGTGQYQFVFPRGVAADAQGNVYVIDTSADKVKKFTTNGTFVTQWGSTGSGNGQFRGPYGIACDEAGNVYVADTSNHRIQKFSPTGTFLTKWGTPGTANGQFNQPMGVAARNGKIFVADTGNNRIQRFGTGASQIAVGDDLPRLEPRLLPVAPNPFRSRTTVAYELPEAGDVRLRVFDVQGRLVASLQESFLSAGRHEATWNGVDLSGQAVRSGA